MCRRTWSSRPPSSPSTSTRKLVPAFSAHTLAHFLRPKKLAFTRVIGCYQSSFPKRLLKFIFNFNFNYNSLTLKIIQVNFFRGRGGAGHISVLPYPMVKNILFYFELKLQVFVMTHGSIKHGYLFLKQCFYGGNTGTNFCVAWLNLLPAPIQLGLMTNRTSLLCWQDDGPFSGKVKVRRVYRDSLVKFWWILSQFCITVWLQ